ncbi:hypothetical protein CAEBREN_11044 [Caenorhabditis brenneri]|uniref:Uncharacterized protein n=1 Tax=Caenorhabditis brenneri TaxID=135651 RepID=G0PJ21_CAEBE|nr:hypothetical protein CAEBREN_11044 [Caenorhabditis brenneri]
MTSLDTKSLAQQVYYLQIDVSQQLRTRLEEQADCKFVGPIKHRKMTSYIAKDRSVRLGEEKESEEEEDSEKDKKADEEVETEGEEKEKEKKEEDEVHVKKEIRSEDEEGASLTGLLMPYSRVQLLNGLQRVASVMKLPISPQKLNQNIVLKHHIFKTSEILDMFHNLIATWIEKKNDYTNDGNLMDLAFKRLLCTITYECFDDISKVRGALKDAIEKTKGTGQVIKFFSFHSSSLESISELGVL